MCFFLTQIVAFDHLEPRVSGDHQLQFVFFSWVTSRVFAMHSHLNLLNTVFFLIHNNISWFKKTIVLKGNDLALYSLIYQFSFSFIRPHVHSYLIFSVILLQLVKWSGHFLAYDIYVHEVLVVRVYICVGTYYNMLPRLCFT